MAAYTEEYNGYQISIFQDDSAESPDAWGDTECFFVANHREIHVPVEGYDPNEIWDECEGKNRLFYEGYHVFVVEAYIHSGVWLALYNEGNFPDRRWDVSLVGLVLVKRTKGRSWHREAARKHARNLVEQWHDYCSGNVYGFVVERDGEHIDSCFGYYGDYEDYCLAEARHAADCDRQQRIKARLAKLKQYILAKVPIMYRQLEAI